MRYLCLILVCVMIVSTTLGCAGASKAWLEGKARAESLTMALGDDAKTFEELIKKLEKARPEDAPILFAEANTLFKRIKANEVLLAEANQVMKDNEGRPWWEIVLYAISGIVATVSVSVPVVRRWSEATTGMATMVGNITGANPIKTYADPVKSSLSPAAIKAWDKAVERSRLGL